MHKNKKANVKLPAALKRKSYIQWLKEAKTVIVNFSGGKDSMALVAVLCELGIRDKIRLLWCRVPFDYYDLDKFILNFAKKNKFEIDVLGGPWTEKEKFEILKKYGYPRANAPHWCTSIFKIIPSREYLKSYDDGSTVVCYGWRREESTRRSRTKIKYVDASSGKMCVMPILDLSEKQVFELIIKHGWKPHKCYEYMPRLGCICCYANKREDWFKMQKYDKDTWVKALRFISEGALCKHIKTGQTTNELRKAFGLQTKAHYLKYGW